VAGTVCQNARVIPPTTLGAAARWDGRLQEWPAANLLQSHAWGEVQARAGWETRRLEVQTSGGVLPISALVTPVGLGGFSRIYVPRGPVCAPPDQAAFREAMQALLELGRERRALALEVEVPWAEGSLPPGHPWLEWEPVHPRQPLATVEVDLRREPDSILASFHSKTRYNIRLAERGGVVVREDATIEELIGCIRVTEARQGIHLPSSRHLAAVAEQLGQAVHILAAEVEGEVVAAILTASFAGQTIYLYGGATSRHRERMPNQLLQWRAMLLARAEGCHGYDLWGIPENDEPDHPWRGLAQFKRGFGGRQIRYAGARSMQLHTGGRAVLALADMARRRVRSRGRR
jgi:lipid II:glycine glycyltransferase (peptidoglycan interpeptide bridge formation enzyme)